ncbi:MAG: amino acid ABC transporter permease [Rhodospirillaceae bacterium]|nr:amino acid ABC transporter permease [Rhodospirillaceae bacterium]MBT4771821.1 amino acid ABC transporter permease [Rhodospirillaceae bacterium]MBT5358662.1 amino acid ABC transporter permease [Rhodospirillaceae bacterium]MBT5768717.1 amino acid ABC transporter permease [Rhodospirillaceae bacterium]MBT6309502.1 amino acid ABC transporter permease [Rhodospirillaceae bacterium]
MIAQRAAPVSSRGLVGWLRANLFSNIPNTILTLLAIYVLWLSIPSFIDWAIFSGQLVGDDRFACDGHGACWAWLDQRMGQFLYGFYPQAETWRVNLAFFLLFPALAPWLMDNVPGERYLRWFSVAYPFIVSYLLVGGFFLEPVSTDKLGGFSLNLVVGLAGIVLSLPVGIVLALGRQSRLPLIRWFSIIFIEVVRGVPLITLLFVSNIILPIFLPPDVALDSVIRVIVMVTAFASAYMAEVIRGGLQAIPQGQYEAAQAMGLSYWKSMRLIILPQALKISIPGIVNTFIGLFKDTTLVIVIGLFDILGIANAMVSNPDWLGLSSETYVVVALFFFAVCFSMSRYSMRLERKLDTDRR